MRQRKKSRAEQRRKNMSRRGKFMQNDLLRNQSNNGNGTCDEYRQSKRTTKQKAMRERREEEKNSEQGSRAEGGAE